ncbi:MAG: ABC transporter permease [Gemmatimonadaceae bacterium]
MFNELRLALRALRKSPAFSLLAVLTLAIGIAVSTTMFSMVHTLLAPNYPFPDPGRVVTVFGLQPALGVTDGGVSPPDYAAMRDASRLVRGLALVSEQDVGVAESCEAAPCAGGEAERVWGARASANLLATLGVRPVLGRDFRADDEGAGRAGVVLISYRLWERRFAKDPGIVGRALRVDGVPRTVVGVVPDGFLFPNFAQLWMPLDRDPAAMERGDRGWYVVGRLAPGATMAAADADLRGIAARLAKEHPGVNSGRGARVALWKEHDIEPETALLSWLLQGAVTFVLLIACANLANLTLTRATGRRRELAVRSALGAGRGRLVRQLLAESLVVAALGGALGVLASLWGKDLLLSAIPIELPYWARIELGAPVLAYAAATTVLSALAFGAVPALQATRTDLQSALRDGGRGSGARRSRLRSGLVVAEFALSMVLLAGASLMIRSFMRIQAVNVGMDVDRVLASDLYLTGERYDSASERVDVQRRVLERLAGAPGVQSAAASSGLPFSDYDPGERFTVAGRQILRGEEPFAYRYSVSSGFLGTMGIALLRGRDISERDVLDATPVAVINQTTARRFFADADPIGARLRLGLDAAAKEVTVVGVAADTKQDVGDVQMPQVYLPYSLRPDAHVTIVARTSAGRAGALAPTVREVVRTIDPAVPVFDVFTMRELAARNTWGSRFVSRLFGVFAAVALLLAAVGVYGVMAYGVLQRRHEIGVRMALGARGPDVLRLVLGQGMRLAALGLAIGLPVALLVGRAMKLVLYEVAPADPVTFVGTPLILAAVGVLATWLPARRATRVDPIQALRYE